MPKVWDPIKVGGVELNNRIVGLPMVSGSTIKGYVTQVMLDLYAERAAGGTALVITEASAIMKHSGHSMVPGVWDDDFLPGLTALAAAIHRGGAKACIQLQHAGGQANPELFRRQVVGPSDNTPPWAGRKVRGLSTKEVEEVIEGFAQAALRAKRAGFDAVMFHATHGFLPQQFMSPWSNPDRGDRFAGPTGFVTEMTTRTKEVVGPDMAVLIRMAADEFRGEAGLNFKLVLEAIAPALEKAGIDAIDLTTGNLQRGDAVVPPLYYQRATFVPYAERLKKVVKIPIIGTGRINDYKLVENLIERERVDLVGLGRQLYGDPELPNKMRQGRFSEIRKCLACDACSSSRLPASGAICAINPPLMRSKDFPMTTVAKPHKVLVIGGGVAGMEAARVAALRGHDVTLMERTNKLGGQVNVSAKIPRVYTGELDNYAKQLMGWIKEAGVKVEMGKEATIDTVRQVKPSVVLLATGSRPLIPDIPGVDGPNVMNEEEAILQQNRMGKKVAILGAARGAELAVSLASGGHEVVILEEGNIMNVVRAPYIFGRRGITLARMVFQNRNIKVIPEVKVKEIAAEGVCYVDKNGAQGSVEADTVVLTLGRVANRELRLAINAIPEVDEVIAIGDASRAKNQLNAIHDGFFAAYGIGDPTGMEAGENLQTQRLAAEQSRFPAPGLDFDKEWAHSITLPHMIPGRELRRSARLSEESPGDK